MFGFRYEAEFLWSEFDQQLFYLLFAIFCSCIFISINYLVSWTLLWIKMMMMMMMMMIMIKNFFSFGVSVKTFSSQPKDVVLTGYFWLRYVAEIYHFGWDRVFFSAKFSVFSRALFQFQWCGKILFRMTSRRGVHVWRPLKWRSREKLEKRPRERKTDTRYRCRGRAAMASI